MSWESPWTVRFFIFISMASSSPTTRASYSAMLLAQAKASLKDRRILFEVWWIPSQFRQIQRLRTRQSRVSISGSLLESRHARPVGRSQLDLLLLPGFKSFVWSSQGDETGYQQGKIRWSTYRPIHSPSSTRLKAFSYDWKNKHSNGFQCCDRAGWLA